MCESRAFLRVQIRFQKTGAKGALRYPGARCIHDGHKGTQAFGLLIKPAKRESNRRQRAHGEVGAIEKTLCLCLVTGRRGGERQNELHQCLALCRRSLVGSGARHFAEDRTGTNTVAATRAQSNCIIFGGASGASGERFLVKGERLGPFRNWQSDPQLG